MSSAFDACLRARHSDVCRYTDLTQFEEVDRIRWVITRLSYDLQSLSHKYTEMGGLQVAIVGPQNVVVLVTGIDIMRACEWTNACTQQRLPVMIP